LNRLKRIIDETEKQSGYQTVPGKYDAGSYPPVFVPRGDEVNFILVVWFCSRSRYCKQNKQLFTSGLFGIPFEGYAYYDNGNGSMKIKN
jgi:hypothetical protein